MGFIYCITNHVNNKQYIGKTLQTIKKRFQQHCNDSKKEQFNIRPLYRAMQKYGIQNFSIMCLEEVQDISQLAIKEIYWIEKLGTYGANGYNATKGGDGSILYDHTKIVTLYNLGYSITSIARKIGCCKDVIQTVLKNNNIQSRKGSTIIEQYSLEGKFIQAFNSSIEAAKWLISNNIVTTKRSSDRIIECCKGKYKTIYGFKWKYKNVNWKI